MLTGISMLDWIEAELSRDWDNAPITLEEFTRIRNEGTPEEIKEAVDRMMEAGGYEALM